MNRSTRVLALLFMVALTMPLAVLAHDHDGGGMAPGMAVKDPEAAAPAPIACALHGGQATMTKARHFETVWADDGLRVYLYSDKDAPQMIRKTSGTVTFHMKDGSTREVALVREAPGSKEEPTVYFCPMHPEVVQLTPGTCPKCGGMKLFTQDRLAAVTEGRVEKADVKITGLAAPETEVSFTVPRPADKVDKSNGAQTGKGAGHQHSD